LGAGDLGHLSFPMEGYTLALDLRYDDELLPLLDQVDDLVLNYGGRVYLAKDARLGAERFALMYPRLQEWLAVKRSIDPNNQFRSDLSERLGIDRLVEESS